jgi:micrococcal nuclease
MYGGNLATNSSVANNANRIRRRSSELIGVTDLLIGRCRSVGLQQGEGTENQARIQGISPVSARNSDCTVSHRNDRRKEPFDMQLPIAIRTTFALFALLFAASTCSAQMVTRVIDGDTIVVAGVGTVRLIGVDTPETVDPRKPVELFGQEASDFTRRMAQGKVVRLEFDFQRLDKYQRTLAYAYLPDGTFLNAEIVKQGYGHAYVKYPFKYLDQFRGYEREARERGRGLWGDAAGSAVVPAVHAAEDSDNLTQLVYLTRTGTKYHREGCRYLARSQIPIALKDAGRYEPCSVCKPPTLRATGNPPATVQAERPPTPTQPATAGQCQAITKKGTQCSRKAQAGSTYCWQHQR